MLIYGQLRRGIVVVGEGMTIGLDFTKNQNENEWIIYAEQFGKPKKRKWLGVYDSDDVAHYVLGEIYERFDRGAKGYEMPSADEAKQEYSIFVAEAFKYTKPQKEGSSEDGQDNLQG